jgi:homeobox protein YOX1/YHP1
MGPQSSAERVVVSRGKEVYPHARSTATPQSVSYGAEPVAPTEEPVIKKKRKRADAAQLKVLNETYQRTAFPSTEERQALATELDMPPRSVQIWYVGILKV